MKEKKTIQISCDDYSPLNFRMASLLKKYDLPAIFFIELRPLGVTETQVYNQIKELAKDFEIGSHTITHPTDMKLLDDERLRYEIKTSKIVIEELIGKKIDWFCYPRGRYNEDIKNKIKEVGYKYARTTLVGNCTYSANDFEVETSIHCYPRKEYKGRDWLELAKEYLLDENTNYFHLWFHSWEIEKLGYWDKLEELFQVIRKEVK